MTIYKNFPANTPPKLCECGCGQPAPIAERTAQRLGRIKGQPIRFIHGHNRIIRTKRPIAERFWSKVDKRGPDECWEWQASTFGPNRYGCFRVDGVNTGAHRISYALANGPIPEGMLVCHRCDNMPCVNPAHLFLGTVVDNTLDKVSKGHSATGSKHGSHTHPEKFPGRKGKR